ncbi:MAG: GNAT family N-acetyltransferase [Treponema sp.]|nr:GNAT family N-acetyltransferase [Treponema sp.]
MVFLPVAEEHYEILKSFLTPYEYYCASLCSSVRKKSKNIYIVLKSGAGNSLKNENDIFGVIYLNLSMLFCLPFLKENDSDFEHSFLNFIQDKKIKCVDGEEKAAQIINKNLQKKLIHPTMVNEYFLMTKEDDFLLPPPSSLLSMGEEIICCNANHLEDLFDLQKSYLKEEVAQGMETPTELYIKSNLKMLLRTQKVFAIETDGKFVAKVNTNAIGWNWVQIGGVYTHLQYRRSGYGLCLMSLLSRRIIKTGRKICLFVKKKNIPALQLYEKLGFKKSCSFCILYY